MLSCFSPVQLFVTLWTIACQAPLPLEFSRQESWSGLPCPPPGDLPDPGMETVSLTSLDFAGRFFITSATWEAPSFCTMLCYAKSLQSCPTLCDPIDGSPPGSAIPGILQARTLEWVAVSFSNAWKWQVKLKSLSRVRLPATPWTAAYQAPPSMGFARQEYWSGLSLPSPSFCTTFPLKTKNKKQVFVLGVHGCQTFHGVSEEVKPCNHRQRFQRFKYVHQAQIEEWIHLLSDTQTYFLHFHLPFSSVQLLSCVWVFATPRTAACQASQYITNSRNLFKLMSIVLVMPSNHLILCHPLLLLPSILPSIRIFSNESASRTRWPKYWSFSFSISLSNEYSGLISFLIDWFDLLAVQGTLKSLLQHHSSKASILELSFL